MMRPTTVLRSLLAVAVLAMAAAAPARAGDLADARATLAKAAAVVESVRQDKNFQKDFDPLLGRARAILVVPSFYKGAFFVGGAYGNGALVVRDDAGNFSPPLFMRVIAGSLGLQFGGQEGQMIFLIMTTKGLDAVLQDQFKVGANVGVSFGVFGAGMEAATTSNMDQDIIVFGHSRGAFGGGALEGASIEPRQEWNTAVYGQAVTAKAVLFDRRWRLDEAEPLYHALRSVPVDPQVGPAAAPAESETTTGAAPAPAATPVAPVSAAPDPAPASTATSAPAPSYSASGQTTGSAADADAPVRLMPVDRQDLQ
jgi:lipid-binding SYLF domain-containing protein